VIELDDSLFPFSPLPRLGSTHVTAFEHLNSTSRYLVPRIKPQIRSQKIAASILIYRSLVIRTILGALLLDVYWIGRLVDGLARQTFLVHQVRVSNHRFKLNSPLSKNIGSSFRSVQASCQLLSCTTSTSSQQTRQQQQSLNLVMLPTNRCCRCHSSIYPVLILRQPSDVPALQRRSQISTALICL